MTLTNQAIPEYVYLELADKVAEEVKRITEDLIRIHNIQPEGQVGAEVTFKAVFTVPMPGESCLPVTTTFHTRVPKPPKLKPPKNFV